MMASTNSDLFTIFSLDAEQPSVYSRLLTSFRLQLSITSRLQRQARKQFGQSEIPTFGALLPEHTDKTQPYRALVVLVRQLCSAVNDNLPWWYWYCRLRRQHTKALPPVKSTPF